LINPINLLTIKVSESLGNDETIRAIRFIYIYSIDGLNKLLNYNFDID
jgi:hypothetical protein